MPDLRPLPARAQASFGAQGQIGAASVGPHRRDQRGRAAKIVWRNGRMLGVRLGDRADLGAINPSDRYALRERYYGILD